MHYKVKALFQNSALLIFSLLSTFVILELSLRVIKNEYTFKNFVKARRTIFESAYPCQYDSHLGWIPKEGFSGRENVWGTRVTILENGIRSNGKEKSEPMPGAVSMLAVGDSFTFGDNVSDHETWPALLEDISKKKVITGGVFGYGLDQIFLRARNLIPIYRPDILILSFIPDDIYRCRLSERTGVAKPYFDIDKNELILKNVPIPKPLKSNDIEGFRGVFGYSLLLDRIAIRAFPNYWVQGSWKSVEVHSQIKAEQVAKLLFKNLRAIIETSTVKQVIILVQYNRGWGPEETALIDRVMSSLEDKSITVVDLRHSFAQLRQQDPKTWKSFFKGHMSPKGNYFVASQLQKVMDEIPDLE